MAPLQVCVSHHHAGGSVGPEYGRPPGHVPGGAVIIRHPAHLVEEEVGVRVMDRLAEIDARPPHQDAAWSWDTTLIRKNQVSETNYKWARNGMQFTSLP